MNSSILSHSLTLTTQSFILLSHVQLYDSRYIRPIKNYMSKLLVFTSSSPDRTTAVFAPALSLSTTHRSVCLALEKLTPGSGDWSICL